MNIKIIYSIFIFIICFYSTFVVVQTGSIVNEIELKSKISKLIANKNNNNIDLYISSRNHLYKIIDFNDNYIKIDKELEIGPKYQRQSCEYSIDSSSRCGYYECDEDEKTNSKRLVDYENLILLLDSSNQNLIECGTIDSGGCRLRRLQDLSIIGCNFSAPVIPFNSATGVISSNSNDDNSILYLMVSNEHDSTQITKSDFPVFSIRNLVRSDSPFRLKYESIESMKYDQSTVSPDFHMKIKYSFKHNGFVYFLFTITNKILSDSCISIDPTSNQTVSKIVTRMLRVCDNNQEMNVEQLYLSGMPTLTETVIDCDDQLTGTKYNLLQSAHFHLNQDSNDDSILFMTFNSSSSPTSSQSVVCKSKIKEIDDHFTKMLDKCLMGDNGFVELFSPYSSQNTKYSVPCRCSMISKPSNYQNSHKLFCQNDVFNYMNSRQPLTIKSIDLVGLNHPHQDNIKSITSLTSLKIDSSNDNLALVLSTLDAKLIFMTLDLTQNKAFKYDQLNLLVKNSKKLSLSSSLSISLNVVNDHFLYVTYDKYLYKVNLQNCDQYKSCNSCLSGDNEMATNFKTKNPFCGWCIYEQKCMVKSECQQMRIKKQPYYDLSSIWLKDESCPSIIDIKPSKFINPIIYTDYNLIRQEPIQLNLNIDILNGIDYYCVLNNEENFEIKAQIMNKNTLKCDLMKLKSNFENVMQLNPIRKKFQNISIAIKSVHLDQDKNASIQISKSDLIAFNCTHFNDCNQCLNKRLNGSCGWCSSTSKCIFTSNNINECPNENPNSASYSLNQCTSYSLGENSFSSSSGSKLEVAYSGDSEITLLLRNPRSEHQTNFICVFSKTKLLNNNNKLNKFKIISSSLARDSRFLTVKTNQDSNQNNQIPFICKYSPYTDPNLDSNLALQNVYLSVWWSSFNDQQNIKNFEGWNQIQFKQSDSEINEDSLSLFDNDDSTQDYIYENNFIELNVINCKVKASSCGKCLDKQLIDLGCGWCRSTQKCTLKKDCPNVPFSYHSSNWMNDTNGSILNGYCSDPKVLDMQPKCGPKMGANTEIILNGENLGHSPFDVKVKMKLLSSSALDSATSNEMDCGLVKEKYQRSSRIVCRTKPITSANKLDIHAFSVYVHTNTLNSASIYSSFNQTNQFIYRYIMPQVMSIEPRKSIRSGGAVLKITGKYLSCGSRLQFTINRQNCSIINITSAASILSSFNNKKALSNIRNESQDLDTIYCRTPFSTPDQPAITYLQMEMDDYVESLNRYKFEYVDDPKIESIDTDKTITSGGIILTLKGRDFHNLQSVDLILSPSHIPLNQRIYSIDQQIQSVRSLSKCNIINSTTIQCLLPEIRDKRLNETNVVEYFTYVQFNGLQSKFPYQYRLFVYQDPKFEDAQEISDKASIILIKGENLLLGVKQSDYKVWVGQKTECNIKIMTQNLITCILPDQINLRDLSKHMQHDINDIRIQIGQRFQQSIRILNNDKESSAALNNKSMDVIEVKYIIIVACVTSAILFSTMIACFVVLKRRQSKQISQLKRMQTEFENLEMRVARECKEAFTELQMDIGELANTLNQTGAPFHDFQTYCMRILFPNANETDKYYLTTSIDLRMGGAGNKENVKNGVLMFSQLILNKNFLLTFIHTLEADTQSFLLQDRVNLASYLSICLHDRMDYFTDILMTLLGELIERTVDSKNNPKILLRRNESIAEKMLTNWFAFLLYDFIKDCAGTPLYILFLSLKQQIYKGPVDAVTCEAKYSLSEDKLIRQSIDYDSITIRVQLQDFEIDNKNLNQELFVKVLNCDTITQVKEKILDSFFKGYPFSKRPHLDDLDLVYIAAEWNNKNSRLILYDEDKTSKIDCDDYRKLNTLSHYKITNGSLLILVPRTNYQMIHNTSADVGSNSYRLIDTINNKNAENMTLLSTSSSKGSSSPPTYSKLSTNGLNDFNNGGVYSAMNGSSVGLTEYSLTAQNKITNLNHKNSVLFHKEKDNHHKTKKYHLIKANELHNSTTPNIHDKSKQQTTAKLVSEVYLTRLLATKGGMQSYVDDFFESVFSTAHGSNVLPFAIKYLFDFLDEQANIHGIADSDVVYTWKSNSLPLRFWVNIIKNPDFVFDIFKSNIVDASLSVIASTFMDSCSQSRLDLNKESPSGKLLFYKEVHKYRKWVESYYSEIKMMPRIDNQDLNEILCEESKKRHGSFNKSNALYRLYNDYVKKYRLQIEKALNDEYQDPAVISINKHLNYRLQQVIYLMDAIEV